MFSYVSPWLLESPSPFFCCAASLSLLPGKLVNDILDSGFSNPLRAADPNPVDLLVASLDQHGRSYFLVAGKHASSGFPSLGLSVASISYRFFMERNPCVSRLVINLLSYSTALFSCEILRIFHFLLTPVFLF